MAAVGAGLDGADFTDVDDDFGAAFLAETDFGLDAVFDFAGLALAVAFTVFTPAGALLGAAAAAAGALTASACLAVEDLVALLISGHSLVAILAANALRSRNINTRHTAVGQANYCALHKTYLMTLSTP